VTFFWCSTQQIIKKENEKRERKKGKKEEKKEAKGAKIERKR
jgi:hypothetical protein